MILYIKSLMHSVLPRLALSKHRASDAQAAPVWGYLQQPRAEPGPEAGADVRLSGGGQHA